ncbi:MAG: tRNA dihydrouridine synthase DusB [Desulfuromonadaceae bacterium]|nr:tRNA dihydrouridine synthase DusB [Desulfuromonadaceae bacterium]
MLLDYSYNSGFKIGCLELKNNVILAPMAGITNSSYRQIHKQAGAGLVFSEMISANGMIRDGKRTMELALHRECERPFALQLFGDDPEIMAQAASLCNGIADMLDINMGCPVKKVIRSGAGSALLCDSRRASAVMASVRQACKLPLSIKIRSGWDQENKNFLEIGHIAEQEGIEAITLHPRTKAQGFSGRAAWEDIGTLKQAVAIPVIGSGDIECAADAADMLHQTGCDGIMLGRGSYGNPWLVRNILAQRQGHPLHIPTRAERGQVARQHLKLLRMDRPDARAIPEMRKHLCWYARGLNGASDFRQQVNKVQKINDLHMLLDEFFGLKEFVPTSIWSKKNA